MHNKIIIYSIVFFLSVTFCKSFAQQKNDSLQINKQDTSARKNILALDTSANKFSTKVATLRSAVLPGWGQAYNKKYWKIPIIYGALGTTAYIFFYNIKTYKILKQAVILRRDNDPSNDSLVNPRFRNFSTASIVANRSAFRQNIDYSVLFFLIFWGLNVVDATVDAHLHSFDVSDNISLRIQPGHSEFANTTGLSFVFAFKDKPLKTLSLFK